MAKVFKRSLAVSLGLIFFLAFYPIKLAQYFYGKLLAKNSVNSGMGEVFAEILCSVQDAVKILLPQAQDITEEIKTLSDEQKKIISKTAGVQFDPELDKEYCFSIAKTDGRIVGYAVQDNVKGKWGVIKYMLALEPDGKVKDVVVLELKERRGRPVKERRFLDQFIGKTTKDQIKLNKDIRGVSGATISSSGMSNGIRKMVYVFNEVYKK